MNAETARRKAEALAIKTLAEAGGDRKKAMEVLLKQINADKAAREAKEQEGTK